MIGLIAKPQDHDVAREFFELFKTPWEFYRPDEQYDVLLCASGECPFEPCLSSKLIVVYGAQEQRLDQDKKIALATKLDGGLLSYKGERFPIYGEILTFLDVQNKLLEEEQSRQPAGVRRQVGDTQFVRIGYDLIQEVRVLLSTGQTYEYAAIPTVEVHIAILRDLIVESGAPLVEIPPIPDGYAFIACLTHDVDHPSIRRHRWDHTAWGFLYRALLGSVLNVLRGRLPIRGLVTNWAAAAKLPFVYLGMAKDFWLDFGLYLGIEQQAASTFFVLPFEGIPGRAEIGNAPHIRASGYGAADIADHIRAIMKEGGEIGLHGIDAWIDSTNGQAEKTKIEQVTRSPIAGVRMHWLYFNAESPALLEKAGFAYDSTVGYNETIGYRAGTTQVYKPLAAAHLLELPMHVMDTALFYPAHLGLSSEEAVQRVGVLMENAVKWGGVLTFNWHDRSIAPERLWGEFYAATIRNMTTHGAWCATAGSTVAWFQRRRDVAFRKTADGVEVVHRYDGEEMTSSLPPLRLRMHKSGTDCGVSSVCWVDSGLSQNAVIHVG